MGSQVQISRSELELRAGAPEFFSRGELHNYIGRRSNTIPLTTGYIAELVASRKGPSSALLRSVFSFMSEGCVDKVKKDFASVLMGTALYCKEEKTGSIIADYLQKKGHCENIQQARNVLRCCSDVLSYYCSETVPKYHMHMFKRVTHGADGLLMHSLMWMSSFLDKLSEQLE